MPCLTLFLVLFWVGCAWTHPNPDPIRYYILASPEIPLSTMSPRPSGSTALVLLPVDLPSYLQSKRMAIRTGSNELLYSDFDQWGERLDQGIARILENSLRTAVNIQSVTSHREGGIPADWEVKARILACEGVRGGPATGSIRFEMTWEITSRGTLPPTIRRGGYRVPPTVWNGTDMGGLARLLSIAVADAALQLAGEMDTKHAGSGVIPRPMVRSKPSP